MQVRAELTRWRLLIAVLLFSLIPVSLAVSAVMYSQPEPPPGPPAYNPVPLGKDDILTALQARELQRSRRAVAEAPLLPGPRILPARFPEPMPTLVLPPRAEPYTLPELRLGLPEAFEAAGDAVVLLTSIEVAEGASLRIEGTTTSTLRLASTPSGFATIIARGGTVDIAGTAENPVAVSSWDVVSDTVDADASDGRAFLLTMGGRMDIAHADLGFLGFGTGTSSGVAWRGTHATIERGAVPAVGDVTNSVLHDNWFGAYTFEAQGMRWIGNTFRDNSAYGFDPHDLSNDFLVEGNVAHGNGRHGFIFSRGCDRNVLRDNVAYDNRGHGFMIDDGRTTDTPFAQAARLPSDRNRLLDNHAYDNDGSGIEIEGGSGTIVRGNLLERNHVGVRVKNDASVLIADNEIVDSALAGVDVLSGSGGVEIRSNSIRGGWASIALEADGAASMADNDLEDASTPLAVAGEAQRDEDLATVVGRVLRWNPLLVLWTAILGIPMTIGVVQVARMFARARRIPAAEHWTTRRDTTRRGTARRRAARTGPVPWGATRQGATQGMAEQGTAGRGAAGRTTPRHRATSER